MLIALRQKGVEKRNVSRPCSLFLKNTFLYTEQKIHENLFARDVKFTNRNKLYFAQR